MNKEEQFKIRRMLSDEQYLADNLILVACFSITDILKRLTSVAMKKVVAGGDSTCPTNCPSKQGCGSECVTECVGRCDMFRCSYDHPGGWVDPCGSFGDCMIMDDCMTMNELT